MMKVNWTDALALAAVAIGTTLVVAKNVDGDRASQLLNVS